jgi:hypothetical protein
LSTAERETLARRIDLAEVLHWGSGNSSYTERSRWHLKQMLERIWIGGVEDAQAMLGETLLREGMPKSDFEALGALFEPAIGGESERNDAITAELINAAAQRDLPKPKGVILDVVKLDRALAFDHHRDGGEVSGFHFRSEEIKNPVRLEARTDNKKDRKEQEDEGTITDALVAYFEAKNLPRELWEPTAAEIERVVRKQVNASRPRPLWDERARYPELAHLPAPEFLKRVWADAIASDGSIEKETIRQKDRALMATVEAYVANRQRRNLDAGLAKGLQFITRRTAPKGAALG